MKRSIRNLKRRAMSAEPVAGEVRRSKRLKVEAGVVPSLAGEHSSRWSRIQQDHRFTEKTSGTNLTSDEEDALINKYRHFLGHENIVGLSVEQRSSNGKESDILVFLVIKLSKSEIIPKKAWLDVENGRRIEINTAVEETGKIVPCLAKGGDAVCAVKPPDQLLGYCTIGAIMPFPDNDSPIRLVTSAHLIDYEEQHKGKMLHYLPREHYRRTSEENVDESFLNEKQKLFPITNFCPVEKLDHKLTEAELANVERNEQDVLWADVEGQGRSPIAGKIPVGICPPRKYEHFNMYGIKSGMHRAKIMSRKFDLCVSHEDVDGRVIYYTYWKNIIKYKLENPTIPGDSGAALMSDDDYVIGLHSFAGEKDGKTGFACRLQCSN